MPDRIRLSRARGWRLPEGTVNVARPGKLGNLFIVGKHGTRAQCAAKFYILSRGFISMGEDIAPDAQLKLYRHIHRVLPDLRGKDVACWCAKDDGACHGDVLILLANPGAPIPAWAADGIDVGATRIGMDARDYAKLRAKAKKERAE